MTALADAPAQAAIQPGVHDIPAEAYHADPVPGGSLSSTGARRLLPPSCPALFRWQADHPEPSKKEFDLGTAAHKVVLGAGPELVRIDADEWRTNAVKEEVAAVRARGGVPLKPAEYDQVTGMAAALREHPLASALFHPEGGRPEQTLIWQDAQTGVWRRAMLDWLPYPTGGRLIIPDYKTCRAADIASIQRAINERGYHQQAGWYEDGALELGLASATGFVFVFQEKQAPYLVKVVQLDADALRIGRERNRRAIEIYAECSVTGHWPGYPDDIPTISLPPWAERHFQETS